MCTAGGTDLREDASFGGLSCGACELRVIYVCASAMLSTLKARIPVISPLFRLTVYTPFGVVYRGAASATSWSVVEHTRLASPLFQTMLFARSGWLCPVSGRTRLVSPVLANPVT